ncbi:hypothetical protein [Halolamina sp.]|uniref:hypothetical protein n=1 Tax=Halolamina sp. TaxID=1940283 RepID=UPI00356B2836
MAETTFLFGLIAVTVVVTLLIAMFRTKAAENYLFRPVEKARTVIGATVIIVGAWTALRSGVVWMMALALGAIAFVTLFVYFEEPHKEIK